MNVFLATIMLSNHKECSYKKVIIKINCFKVIYQIIMFYILLVININNNHCKHFSTFICFKNRIYFIMIQMSKYFITWGVKIDLLIWHGCRSFSHS